MRSKYQARVERIPASHAGSIKKQKIKTLIIEMPAELHAAFVLKAKSDDLSMAQVVRRKITEYVAASEAK